MFSHKLLILIPLIIVPLLAIAGSVFVSKGYEVSTTMWVESSPLLGVSVQFAGPQLPSEAQAIVLNEWLRTNSFVLEVMKRANLYQSVTEGTWPKPTVLEEQLAVVPQAGPVISQLIFKKSSDPDARLDQATEYIRKSLTVGAASAHIVKVSYSGNDSEAAVRLINSTIQLFNEKSTESKVQQARMAVDFFQSWVREYQASVEESSRALRQFKEEHPAPADPALPRPPSEEQALRDLERRYSLNQTQYQGALDRLEQARLAGQADLLRTQGAFTIADQPEAPKESGFNKRQAVLSGFIGLLVGLSLGLGIVLVMAWGDRSIRSTEDLLALTGIPVVAAIPHLEAPKKRWSMQSWREWKDCSSDNRDTRFSIFLLLSWAAIRPIWLLRRRWP